MSLRITSFTAAVVVLLLLTGCNAQPAVNITATPSQIDTERVFPLSAVAYPTSYRADFVHYVTVDRADDTVRDIYINPEAVAELRRSRRLPDDTIIVVEAYDAQLDEEGDPLLDENGHLIKGEPMAMVHVAHKNSGWRDHDFPSTARAGEWNYGSFTFETGAPFDEDLAACANCHQARPQMDFVYSTRRLLDYAATETTQYLFCNLARRIPCE